MPLTAPSPLMQALQFNNEDLRTNKGGGLSMAQRQVLKENYAKTSAMIKKFGLVVVVLIPIFYLFQQQGKDINIPVIIGITVFSAIFYAGIILWYKRLEDTVMERNFNLEVLSGPIEIRVKDAGISGYNDRARAANLAIGLSGMKVANCELHIAGKKIYLLEEVAKAFENGKNYTIYCIKENSMYMPISAEQL